MSFFIHRDNTIYDLKQEKASNKTTEEGLKSHATLGQKWFDAFDAPENVTYVLQLGFARDNGRNYTGQVGFIQEVFDHIGGCDSPKFHAVELGNEPNLYVWQERRDPGYSVTDYARQAAKSMDVLQGNISCLAEGRNFQVWSKSSNLNKEAWYT